VAKNYYDIALAFAGMNQSAKLVQELAHTGYCDSVALSTSLNSIIQTNPASTLAVFGQEKNLNVGLETSIAMLSAHQSKFGVEILRYCSGMIGLERKLQQNQHTMDMLSQRISQLDRQLNHFDITSDTIMSALSDIYVDVVSPLGTKIQVVGSPNALQQASVQAKVRATLLAGIRATVLWRQVGGNRLQLLFSRKHILNQSKQIINRI